MAKGKYEEWLTGDGLIKLEGWARNGLTDEQIAHNCGVSASTLREWKKKHLAISEALKKGKEVVDLLVENALLKRALGYTYEEKTYERVTDPETGERGLTLTRIITKEVIPDTVAQIYWLKNRKRSDWRDNHDKVEIDRERLEIDKRVADAQIAKIERENNEDTGQDIEFTFDEAITKGGWQQ